MVCEKYNIIGIINNFWRLTSAFNNAIYACINLDNTSVPKEINKKSICIHGDIYSTVSYLNVIGDKNDSIRKTLVS